MKIFIVGCSRSGTTLLQTLIASHPKVITFPETNFFYKTVGLNKFKRIITWLGFCTGLEKDFLNLFVKERLGSDLPDLKKQPIFYQKAVNHYVSLLNHKTQKKGSSIWVEKTPKHIFSPEWIMRFIPDAKIIHIIRDGREVVASIQKRRKKFPDEFKNQDLEYSVNLWNTCISKTEKLYSKERNFLVRYEDLVTNPKKTLNEIGRNINLDYSEVDINNRYSVLNSATYKSEDWKNNIKQSIKSKNNKFDIFFTKKEREYVKQHLADNIFYNYQK